MIMNQTVKPSAGSRLSREKRHSVSNPSATPYHGLTLRMLRVASHAVAWDPPVHTHVHAGPHMTAAARYTIPSSNTGLPRTMRSYAKI